MTKLKSSRLMAFAIAIILVIANYLITYIVNGGIFFISNDDYLTREILSGEFTGMPSPFTTQNNIVFGFLISSLYRISRQTPWFGIILVLTVLISFAYVYYKCLLSTFSHFFKAIIILLLTIPLYFSLTDLQFTISAAVLSAAGIFSYIINHEPKHLREHIPTVLFFILSFLIRADVFYMSIPFIGLIFILKLIPHRLNFIQGLKKHTPCLLILFVTICLFTFIHKMAYSTPEWKEFADYNEQRIRVRDYGLLPVYSAYTSEYEKLGISEIAYKVFSSATLESNISTEHLSVLTDFAKTLKPKQNAFSIIKQSFWAIKSIILYSDLIEPVITRFFLLTFCFCFFSVFIFSLFSRLYTAISYLAAVGIAHVFCWCYLFSVNRYPDDVLFSLFLIDIFAITAIFSKFKGSLTANKGMKICGILLVLCTIAACLNVGLSASIKANALLKSKENSIQTQARALLRQYVGTRPDALFFYAQNSFGQALENAYKPPIDCSNLLASGSWISRSPLEYEILSRFGFNAFDDVILAKDNVYFAYVSNDSEIPEYLNVILEYIKPNCPNAVFIIDEQIKLNHPDSPDSDIFIAHFSMLNSDKEVP